MRLTIALFALLIAMLIPASAVKYEREPSVEIISVSYVDVQKGITTPISSNYIGKGDKILVVTIYNPAVREEVEYDNQLEAGFFNSREDMLFTAYNVELELIGNDAVKVKTGKIKLPALPAMSQQVSLQFYVEIGDVNETELKLKITYERIEGLKSLTSYYPYPIITGRTDTITNSTSGITITNTTSYRYDILVREYELDYVTETQEVPIKLYVEEKDVLLEVKEVKVDKLIAGGKGNIEVTIKNVGKKTAKNAYATIELPKSQQTATQSMASIPSSMLPFMMSSSALTPSSATSTSQPSYFIGDLKPGETAKASFYVSLDVPKGGVYPAKVKVVYSDEYGNLKESDSVSFGVTISSKPEITIKTIDSRLFVNSKGDLIVKMVSNVDLEDASARVVVSSPLSALSSECYIGDVKSGEDFTAFFKLKASSEARATKYPVDLYVKFKTGSDFVESDAIKIGVEVKPEIEFEVIGTAEIMAGEEKVIKFAIRNTGSAEIKDATARLIIVSPFTSSDDTAYIGALKPGEIANASFKLSADRDATPKLYALNLEVKYKAENGDWVISAPSKAVIDVKSYEVSYTLYLILAILIIAGAIYYLRRRR
ncbi:MAG: S-layer protein [Archaeoglobaceae archaeon]|nr:S-layer protein [Archaeoglobaceae archaeon]MDW8118153.1 S-layer protein [Archaeoglobaceae archaeon]